MGHSSRQQQAENKAIKKSTFMEKPPPPWLMLKTYPSHPWALDTEPFATHPWIGQWLVCMLVLALMLSPLHFNQPCWLEGGRCTPPSKPSYQVFSIPSTPAALDSQPPTSWDVARHETKRQSLQNSKHVFFKYKQI